MKNFFRSLAHRMLGLGPSGQPQTVIRHVSLQALPPSIAPHLDVDRIRSIYYQAEAGQTDEYFRLVADMFQSDPDLIAALTQRKAAFIAKSWNLTTPKGASMELQSNAEFLRRQLEGNQGFNQFLPHLPTGGLWPAALGRWHVKAGNGRDSFYDLDTVSVIPWSRLDFSGGLGERPAGTLGVKELSEAGEFTGNLCWPEIHRGKPARGWIVHRGHALTDFPDAWGGPIRAAVMWWFFGIQVRQLWANYVERGSYLIEGRHEANDSAGRQSLLDGFAETQRTSLIVVSQDTEVKVHNLANQSGAAAYKDLIKHASDQLLKVILGSTMTVNASANGFGGNQGAVQADATGDIFAMDAALAANTVRTQIMAPLLALNGRNPAALPAISWGGQSEDQAALAGILATLKQAGLRPTGPAISELSERLGFAVEPEAAPPLPRTFSVQPAARRNMLLAAAEAGAHIDRAAAAGLTRAARGQFAGLGTAIQHADTAAEALAACDSWLATFNADPVAGELLDACSSHAANGALKAMTMPSLAAN